MKDKANRVLFIILFLVIGTGMSLIPEKDNPFADEHLQIVEGFSSIVSYAYTWDYPSYRGAEKSWGAYAVVPAWDNNPPTQQIIWETDTVPDAKDTIFVFIGSNGEDAGGMALYLDDNHVLTFESGINEDKIWRGNYGIQLFFDYKGYVVGNNGIYYLFIPKNKIEERKKYRIKVSPIEGKGKSWFMAMGYKDVINYEGISKHRTIVSQFLKKETKEKKITGLKEKIVLKMSPSTVLLMNFKNPKRNIANDESLYKNYGEIYGAKWTKEGILFDGSKEYIKINHKDVLNPLQQFTIQAVIKVSPDKGDSRRIIISKDGNYSLSLFYGVPEGSIWIKGKEFTVFPRYRSKLNDSNWHRIGMSYDGYILKLVVDGEFYGSQIVSGNIDTSSEDLYISTPENSFEGIISAIKISSTAIEMQPILTEIKLEGKEVPVVIISDKPFFPIGLYAAVPTKDNLSRLKKMGFNLVGPREHFQIQEDGKLKEAKEFLDKVHESGLRTWLSLWYKVNSPILALRAGAILTEEREEKIKYIKRFVSAFRNHPAPLMWDIGDELSQDSTLPIEKIVDAYRIVKELDPVHPIWANHPCWKVPKKFSVIADVHSGDLYPLYDTSDADISIIGRYVDDLCELVDYKKPVWMVLQADHTNGGRFPTDKELRFMTYSSIVHGAKGILYFAQDMSLGWTPEFWKTIEKITKELDFMAPILVGETYKKNIKIAFEPQKAGIKGICKDYNREKYLIVINEEPAPIKATFTFSSLTDISDIEVLFEGRTIKSTGKTFADLFQGYEVHIYKIEGGRKK